MPPSPLASLTDAALVQRLAELTGEQRQVLVDFLLHLDEFDRRRAFLQAGYDSLWTYCLGALHLREGPAARRIGAMRMLRRFPALEEPLRDGRLCISTVRVLAPLMTEANVEELIARAAFLTKAATEELVVALQPRAAPRDGIRSTTPGVNALDVAAGPHPSALRPPRDTGPVAAGGESVEAAPANGGAAGDGAIGGAAPLVAPSRSRVEIEAVARERWSMRVTLDAEMKTDLDLLASLASHKTGPDLAAVLHEAIRCGIEKLGKRKGAVVPSRSVKARGGARQALRGERGAIPAEVRRQVFRRDGGRCTWTVDGRRCGSRYKLEFDHVVPVARGGASTVGNVRLLCAPHNALHAEQTFGAEHMARFRAVQLGLG